jgi:hypothetical protein
LEQADLRDMFKKISKSVCTSIVAVSPDPLSPTPTSSALKTPENTEEDSDDPELADKGDIEVRQYRYRLIIWNIR